MTAPSGVSIRLAVIEDARAVARLHVDVWEDAYTGLMPAKVFELRRRTIARGMLRWRQWLAEQPNRTFVAEDANGLIGFASVGPPRTHDVTVDEELFALYVRGSHWGTGVGHVLLASALAQRPAYLWVLHGNDRAITFYRKSGFIADGATRTGDYGTEDRMVRRTLRPRAVAQPLQESRPSRAAPASGRGRARGFGPLPTRPI